MAGVLVLPNQATCRQNETTHVPAQPEQALWSSALREVLERAVIDSPLLRPTSPSLKSSALLVDILTTMYEIGEVHCSRQSIKF